MAVANSGPLARFTISSAVHAVIDYLTAGTLLTLPRLLGARRETCDAATALGMTELTYTLLTDHEGGIYKIIPLRAHLAMDIMAGLATITLPFTLEEDDDDVTWTLFGLGVLSILVPAMTRTNAAPRHHKRGGFVTPETDWVGSRKDGLGSLGTPVTFTGAR